MRVTLALDEILLFDSGNRDHAPSAVKAVATFFAGLSDDEQAQFFEEVGQIVASWPNAGATFQASYIGRHMTECKCITDVGRNFLRTICQEFGATP